MDLEKQEEEKYLYIGEVADLMGGSRDTIRIYEEQGLITPKRDENGFRRYTEADLDRLVPVKFYRENAFPMKNLRRLMNQKTRTSSLELLEEQIRSEQLEVLRHQRNIERLELARTYYQTGTDTFELCTVGNACRISKKRETYYETLVDWFQESRDDSDKIISYLNVEYDLNAHDDRQKCCYLLLKESEAVSLNRQDLIEQGEILPGGECLRAVVHTEKQLPGREVLEAACRWAEEHGLKLQGKAHAHGLYLSDEHGKTSRTFEVVLPLA